MRRNQPEFCRMGERRGGRPCFPANTIMHSSKLGKAFFGFVSY
jgi:hypothetical protein